MRSLATYRDILKKKDFVTVFTKLGRKYKDSTYSGMKIYSTYSGNIKPILI